MIAMVQKITGIRIDILQFKGSLFKSAGEKTMAGISWGSAPFLHDVQGTVAPAISWWWEKWDFPSRRRFPWRVQPLAVAKIHPAPGIPWPWQPWHMEIRPRATAASLLGARQGWNLHYSILFPIWFQHFWLVVDLSIWFSPSGWWLTYPYG